MNNENDKVNLALEQNKITEYDICNSNVILEPATQAEVLNAIKSLNTGKAADSNGISSEHLSHAARELAPVYTDIITIFSDLDVPKTTKILTPVHKKEKDKLFN